MKMFSRTSNMQVNKRPRQMIGINIEAKMCVANWDGEWKQSVDLSVRTLSTASSPFNGRFV